jgi:hypothetical protein
MKILQCHRTLCPIHVPITNVFRCPDCQPQLQNPDYESLLRLGGGLALGSLSLPFVGGGLLEARLRRGGLLLSLLAFLAGGLGLRLGLVEYLLRRGGGDRDTETEGLRLDLDFGGGERDREDEELRPRRLGGDREREDE